MNPSSRRQLRLAFVFSIALVPLVLGAQSGPKLAPAVPSDASSVVMPFTGPGWQDRVLSHEGYVQPPRELADAVLAPRYLNVTLGNMSPDKKWFLNQIGDGPVPMKTFSKPFHELGGVFIDYKASRARALTIRNDIGIEILSAADGTKRAIQVPPGARVSNATWSPDSTNVAYFVHNEDSTHVWIADVATGKSHQLTTAPVLATLVSSFDFTEDGKQIAIVLAPDQRGPIPQDRPAAPTGPEVKISLGSKASLRTFPSLMHTPHDYALLEWHATGQAALVDVATRAVKKVGAPAMFRSIDASPDGQFLRVTRMTKPFSYIVPVSSFGQVEEVWDLSGKVLAKLTERAINLGAQPDDPATPPDPTGVQAAGGGGRGGNQNGKRELTWRTDRQGFSYLEQEPLPPGANAGRGAGGRGAGGGAGGRLGGGQGAAQGPPRPDRLMQWLPPYDAASMKLVYQNPARMTGHRFSPDMSILFFSESTGTGQNQTTTDYAVYLQDPSQRYTLARHTTQDQNAIDPGALLSIRSVAGRAAGAGRGGGGAAGPVQMTADGTSVFYQGTIYDKNPQEVGPKTFLDRVAIKTGEKTRVYESDNKDVYERISQVLDADGTRYVLLREGPTTVPQNILVSAGARKQLTNNEDIAPDLTLAPKQRFSVSRPDGFHFKVTVTLPPGYQAGTRLPAIFWFYPAEYESQDAYDRPDRTFNKNSFPNFGPRSMQFFARLGYAVVEPDSPIVGAAGQMNNNYVNDLRNNLSAVIDDLDRRGLIDRTKLAIGGHSYGAFSTVNAMVNTPFFKAGIAGDGAYNRTLTPFGFQNERRTLWEAPSVYFDMSPFLKADHLTGALLMYHGLADQNVGTDPINSERLFQALNELGKTAAMYRYPLEDHGPASRETLLDLWARWGAWLDKYVKNSEPPVVKPAPNAGPRGGS